MKESKESQLLWSILLKIICFDDICKATLSNQRFATEAIAVLKKYISVMNAEREAIEDQTRVLTRTDENVEIKNEGGWWKKLQVILQTIKMKIMK